MKTDVNLVHLAHVLFSVLSVSFNGFICQSWHVHFSQLKILEMTENSYRQNYSVFKCSPG